MPNRLASETSPYLQQHADNPVDWYPWGEEALALAKAQNKPILLSVGYSACHWCHVMAHESFEDADVAAIMNRHFVNIKVDREERPDIDQIYQSAHHLMSQRAGGWPLTMFLTPDTTPFFGGTYFPKTPRYGLPGFADLLGRVAEYYHGRREEVEEHGVAIRTALARMAQGRAGAHASELTAGPLDQAVQELAGIFDRGFGGFGGAPKFPHPDSLGLLLRRFAATGDRAPLQMVEFTLVKMAEGGLYDQLGGGFARYSVDQWWMIPHFEKMLYDNAQLLTLYADAWCITGRPLFQRVVEETAAWVMREMQSPEGGYYSTLDADSEGHEGKFYVWTPAEVRALLNEAEYTVAAPHYGLDQAANFEGEFWHLRVAVPVEAIAQRAGTSVDETATRIATARTKLFAARERRVRPGRDEKILTSWNALMIQAMARAARVFGRADWLASARRALDFARTTLTHGSSPNVRLYATYKAEPGGGRAHLNAYLDDYAFLLAALIEMLQADFRADDLVFAEDLGDALLEQFTDRKRGGFFFTSHDHETLIQRPKPAFDNATPSGNGVAAWALNRLAYLTGDMRFQQAAEATLATCWPTLIQQPSGCASLLAALEETLTPPRTVILRGERKALDRWAAQCAQGYLPDTLVLALAEDERNLPAALDKPARPGAVNGYVCQGVTCLEPVSELAKLDELLRLKTAAEGGGLE